MTERPEDLLEYGPVTLRRHRADDLDAVFQAVTESLDHLRPWMPWAANYTRESAAEFLAKSARDWADGTEYGYAILADSVLAGGCINPKPGAYNLLNGHLRFDLGKLLHSAAWRGLALVAHGGNLANTAVWLPDWKDVPGDSIFSNRGRTAYLGIEFATKKD